MRQPAPSYANVASVDPTKSLRVALFLFLMHFPSGAGLDVTSDDARVSMARRLPRSCDSSSTTV